MILCTAKKEVSEVIAQKKAQGLTIGLVPTMGALHVGHQSLVEAISPQCDFLCLWVFVNPTQFNDRIDYERYPRRLQEDKEFAKTLGVDLLFAPSEEEIYPAGIQNYDSSQSVRVRSGERADGYEGERRPGHFDGVVHVCASFFNILQPDIVVFGEKDYQQVQVIEQLLADLHFPISLLRVPIARETSGLAYSSRNLLLDDPLAASCIYQAMLSVKENVSKGRRDSKELCEEACQNIEARGYRIDYFDIVDAETLKPLEEVNVPAQLLVAVFAENNVRLIDNLRLN